MTPNRKRGRHSLEDETEFMPLSKRINNLHINSNLLLEHQKTAPESWGLGVNCPDSPPLSVHSVEWNQLSAAPYNPELNESQNPYYYNNNKLLYEMYVARQERSNQ